MSQNALGQSDCTIFQSTRSLEQSDEKAFFFATNSKKLKADWNILLEGVVKNRCCLFGVTGP